MDLELEKRTALVLGASSGLGRAMAARLAMEGARVAICGRDRARIETAAREIGARPYVCDVADLAALRALHAALARDLGGVDILITNTGGPPKGTLSSLSQEDWLAAYDSLFRSVVECLRLFVPGMRTRRWGRVLLLTSVAAREPIDGLTLSNSFRAGLLGLMKSASNECAADGITVNALLPGFMRTERLKELGVDEAALTRKIPAGRLGKPEELADLAAFLASERAAYVTGQAIAIDGGTLRSV